MNIDLLFVPDAWGKGYATEIGAAVLRAGFEGARLASIVAFTGTPHVLYRATAGF
ncbi:MAG TPA: GNAT family N-acetyltransferase [Elusimicrobiota bacterium]|nr:GNAT family N-acetyltransferase [Elusimicrobiota bacterium]